MQTVADIRAEELIASWRTGGSLDGFENPAGPLFPGGEFAESELTMEIGCSRVSKSCVFKSDFTMSCC
jgi:hypothetical protein